MNIGQRISWVYSAITILVVVLVGCAFWIMAGHYCNHIYYRHLEEKVEYMAKERFERDEMDSLSYRQLIERRAHAISTDRCVFVNLNDAQAYDQLAACLSDAEYHTLLETHAVRIRRDRGTSQIDDDEMGAGIVYSDNEGDFAVLLFSHNPYLRDLSQSIGWGLLVVVVFTALLLYLISRLYAARMVNDIAEAYQAERLFIDNASHEISNPLTAVKGECEIALMRQRSADDYRKVLGKISWETDRIIAIMRELIQLSHAEKECAANQTTVALSVVLAEFQSDQVQLSIVEDFTIKANVTLLQIAFRNILSNAVKYGNGRPVSVKVNRNEVVVCDQGIGIPQKDMPHIFNPFYRASNATVQRGHGIGLALAYKIFRATGFKVRVKSSVDQGTTFILRR